jgi:membrane protein insertase Oxa1/YidC/SpoIIIJ
MPDDKDAPGLRKILKDAGSGKPADQSDVSAAVGRSTRYIIPVMIFVFTVNIAAALSLYWFVGGLVALIQQGIVLRRDEEEMEAIGDEPSKKKSKDTSKIPEAEVVATPAKLKKKKSSKKKRKKK